MTSFINYPTSGSVSSAHRTVAVSLITVIKQHLPDMRHSAPGGIPSELALDSSFHCHFIYYFYFTSETFPLGDINTYDDRGTGSGDDLSETDT
jgi:hypothetical protein